jgi:hypothetical protein
MDSRRGRRSAARGRFEPRVGEEIDVEECNLASFLDRLPMAVIDWRLFLFVD